MRNKIKKIMTSFLVLFTVLSSFASNLVNVSSASVNVSIQATGYTHTGTAYVPNGGGASTWFTAQSIDRITLTNGEIGFCVEPWTLVSSFTNYQSSTETRETFSRIIYHGYWNTNQTMYDYAVTQLMIWEQLGYIPTSTTVPNYATRKSQIQNLINSHSTRTSFHAGNYEVDLGSSITLTDTNNVLGQFSNWTAEGCKITVSGNNLTITPSIDTPDSIIITADKYAQRFIGASFVYRHTQNSQEIYSGKLTDPTSLRINLKVNKLGSVKIAKTDDEGAYIPYTTYKLSYNSDMSDLIGEYATGNDGTIQVDNLKPQMVYIQEVKVPQNLVLNPSINSIMIVPNEVVTFSQMNKIQKGKVIAKKVDNDTSAEAQGEGTLAGATYGLFTKEDIVNPINKNVLIPANTMVAERTTKEDGTMDSIDNLYLGKYYLQELSASEGYKLNNEKIDVTLVYGSATAENVEISVTSKETVITGDFDIEKVITNGQESEIVEKEKGAEFIVVLKKYVEQYGSIEEAYNHRDEYSKKEYDKLVTNEDGYDKSNPLAFGTYVVKQVKGKVDTDLLKNTWEFKVEKQNQKTLRYIINNRPFTSQVKLIKVDAESGEKITLNSAKFKIKDSQGNYVTQKVSGIKYDTFTTNSKNNVIPSVGKEGEAILPLQLSAQTYTIEEVEVPDGFLVLDYTPTFTISNIYEYEEDEDKDPIIEVKIKNAQPKGSLIVNKTDKESAMPLEKVEYELTAKSDIINMIDGSVLFKSGEIVSQGATNADGQLCIDNLPMGNYSLREVLTNEGYVLSEKTEEIIFKQTDNSTKHYKIEIDCKNISPKGRIIIKKIDADTKESLSGVIYQLKAKENIYSLDGRNTLLYTKGETISKDISEDGLYMTNELGEIIIDELPLGIYELKEFKALNSHVTDNSVYDINLSYDGSERTLYVKTINLTNSKTIVELSKVDITNNKELPGAKMTLTDSDNKVIETWTSTERPHIIRGLEVNKEYILTEDTAPLGYVKAESIIFTVEDTEEIQKVVMKDEVIKVEISKQDFATGEELTGATLQIIDDNGIIVHEWTTDGKVTLFERLPSGNYTLKEISSPNGYEIAESVEFTVTETSEIQKVVMKDKRIPNEKVETGDNTAKALYIALLVASGICITMLNKRNKKKEK